MYIGKERVAPSIVFAGIILMGTTGLLAKICPTPPGPVLNARCCTVFTGEASGGTLIMWDNLSRNAPYVAIETIAGEPAEKAIGRLAETIDNTNPFHWGGFPTGQKIVKSSEGELQGILGSCAVYMTAGTETGLGIPQPPHSLTASYDPNLKKLELRWINPMPDAYDSIRVRLNCSNYAHTRGDGLPGNSESYIRDLSKKRLDMNDLDILVIGVRNDIPSNAAAIHVNNNAQEERYGIPFTSGLAPNWQRWSLGDEDTISPQMGIRNELTTIKGRPYNRIKAPQDKPFYQIINTGTEGGIGGVYRKFIGLTPEHTYRIKARVATLSEPNEKNWSVSVHAAANNPDGLDLSPGQMAGLDALPCGGKSNAAGRMALYDSSLTTKGQFVEISTDKAERAEQGITDITLPPGVDSITVWLRCDSSSPMSAALDWISLEDLSMQIP